ncbi:hypothetical protein NEUTE2DRAFT_48975, partial [Neurospora tetrasperma FGSC 2509]
QLKVWQEKGGPCQPGRLRRRCFIAMTAFAEQPLEVRCAGDTRVVRVVGKSPAASMLLLDKSPWISLGIADDDDIPCTYEWTTKEPSLPPIPLWVSLDRFGPDIERAVAKTGTSEFGVQEFEGAPVSEATLFT